MVGKLLKQHPKVKAQAEDIKFDPTCTHCVNLKQDVMNLHYWKKVYEKSAKETVRATMLTRQLADTIAMMEKDKEEDMAYMIEQRQTKKEYEGAYNQLRAHYEDQ